MFEYVETCGCGCVEFTLTLPKVLHEYSPRQCDCEFCTNRNISYLSDPSGYLVLKSTEQLEVQHQGSEQADFLSCSNCKTVVAVSANIEDKVYGALNASLLPTSSMRPPTVVSPKLLNAEEKVNRWKSVWLHIHL